MKIIHWDEMFHPDFGYQINLLSKFQAAQGHEVIIMTSEKINEHPTFSSFANKVDIEKEDKIFSEKYNVQIVRLPIYGFYSGRVLYKPGYLEKIKDYNADVLFCHTNDTLSGMWITLNYRKLNMPIVFDNHMLKMASKNPLSKVFRFLFRKIITPIIQREKFKVIRTQDDDYVNSELGIPSELTPYISFGSDTMQFYQSETANLEFRENNGIDPQDFVICYAGKITKTKGLDILADAIQEKFLSDKKVTFMLIGNIQSEEEIAILEKFKKSSNKILFFPTQKYENLPRFYQATDLFIFPKQCSLSFFDVQACGVPVIAENNNINTERLSFRNGLTYESGNANDLRKKIDTVLNFDNELYSEYKQNSVNYIKSNFDYLYITEKYNQVIIEELNKAR